MSVKIVGLDESGQFENVENKHFRFVGGYTLICKSLEKQKKLAEEKDKEKLRKKIREQDKQERDSLIIEVQSLLSLACDVFDQCAHHVADGRYRYEQGSSSSAEKNKMLDILEKTAQNQQKKNIPPIGDAYHVMYPLSLHGSEETFFKRNGSTNKGIPRYSPYQSDSDNYNAWEELFQIYIRDVSVVFLKKKGAKLFCYLYPELKISNDDTQESNVLNFAQGTNLYEYMSQAAVMNEIMYYPESALTRYTLELATRSVQIKEMNPEDVRNLEIKAGEDYLLVTSKNTYRTAVANMLNSFSWTDDYSEADYDIDVQTIKYHQGSGSYLQVPSPEKQTPLHYLSDIVCDLIREQLKGKKKKIQTEQVKNEIKYQTAFIELAENNDKITLEIRVLGEADLLYRRMIAALHEYKLADYYGYWYDLKNLKDKHGYSDFYIEYWVKKKLEPMREEYMLSRAQANEIINYLPYGYEYAKNLIIKEEYEKSLFVAEKIREALQDDQNKNKKTFVDFFENASFLNLIRFRFNGIILRGYNHRGEIDGAIRIIKECEKSASYVSPEEYLDFTICTIQFFFNTFQYTKISSRYAPLVTGMNMKNGNSEQNSQQLFMNKSPLEQMSNILSEIQEQAAITTEDKVPLENMHMTVSGRIHSSLAQAYSFAQNQIDQADKRAKKRFNDALDIFSDDKGNRDITLCHYLHYLIMNGKKEEFELKSTAYFEEKTFDLKAYKKVIPGGRLRFAIYLYIKAFWKFYSTEKNRSLFEEILADIKAVDEKFQKEHPWQLIYMNLYKIAKKYNMENELDGLRKKVHSCVEEKSFTVEMLNLNFELQCIAEENTDFDWGVTIEDWLKKASDNRKSNAIVTEILEKYTKYIKEFLKIQLYSTFQDLKNALEKVCTYEYC